MNNQKPWLPTSSVAFSATRKAQQPVDLISVCVTVFNYAEYIEGCLNSIHAQVHKNLELLIVDDNSEKDDSLKVAVAWAKKMQPAFFG